jgi:hypothetical protein
MGELVRRAAVLVLATLTACGTDAPSGDAKPAAKDDHPYISPTYVVPTLDYPVPKPADFTLTTKTLRKQCFGSAGCNVTYRIKAGWSASLDPAKTYEVSYEVRGVEDGPSLGTIDVTGGSYETEDEVIASTSGPGKKLTVVVTGVEVVGG